MTELLSIIKLDVYSPSIDTTYFTNTASSYWSSITGGSFETTAWLVNFNDGYSDWDGKVTGRYVRCVR
ncbi:MAG: DUF1566 domain-containing protein [Candidatus Peribacteria bacterium]|nr:DUF1566 domain-containing protein [Candidatus Peribacteria bacterium]